LIVEKEFCRPSFYKKFSCKGGDCRHTCCKGLTINITEDEYFRLLGIKCSESLRENLDLSLHVRKNADPYKYAQISPDFFGKCRMLTEDGLCMLHGECGPDALSSVCKYFPRSPRFNISPRISTSLGCEETIEILMDLDEEITFEKEKMTLNLESIEEKDTDIDTDKFIKYQEDMFEILKKEDTFVNKLKSIRDYLGCDFEFSNDDMDRFIGFLEFAKENYADIEKYSENILNILKSIEKDSLYIDEIISETIEKVNMLENTFPNINDWLSRFMINEIFYKEAPYMEKNISVENAGKILYIEGMLLIIYLAYNLNVNSSKVEFIDLCVHFFKMCDFTSFEHNILAFFAKEKEN